MKTAEIKGRLDLDRPPKDDSVVSLDPVKQYLKEISETSLLNAEQERSLAQEIEKGRIASILLNFIKTKNKEELPSLQIRASQIISHSLLREIDVFSDIRLVLEDNGEIDNFLPPLSETVVSIEITNKNHFVAQCHHPQVQLSLHDFLEKAKVAKEAFTRANLRLVVSIAKQEQYQGRGLEFMDLIQEGNVGLMRAVEKFEWWRGNKFSTYATPWIKQAIDRGIADQGKEIRLPVHIHEDLGSLGKTARLLEQELGREPTKDEIAERLNVKLEKIETLLETKRKFNSLLRLDLTVGEDLEDTFGDFIVSDTVSIDEQVFSQLAKEDLRRIIEENPRIRSREKSIIILRFGLEDDRQRSLEEVGKVFGITRERVRQLEIKTLKKLRFSKIAKKLRGYYLDEF